MIERYFGSDKQSIRDLSWLIKKKNPRITKTL